MKIIMLKISLLMGHQFETKYKDTNHFDTSIPFYIY